MDKLGAVMQTLEERFYETFDLQPDKKTMAVFCKSYDEDITKENYPLRKAKILTGLLKCKDELKDTVKTVWYDTYAETQNMFEEYKRNGLI